MATQLAGIASAPLVNDRLASILRTFNDPGASAPDILCDGHDAGLVAFRFVGADGAAADVTFGALGSRSRKVARLLHELGVGEGDRVATLLGKGADLPAVILGIWRLGAVYVPLFTAFAAGTVEDRLVRANVKVVVTDDTQRVKVPDEFSVVRAHGAGDTGLSYVGDLLTDIAALEEWTAPAPTGPDVPIVHMFTSGTTGKPKTVVHPLSYAAGWQAYVEFGLGVTVDDVFWCGADPGWAYGLYTVFVGPMALGVRSIVGTSNFSPDATWAVFEAQSVTNFAAAPTAFRALRGSRPQPDPLPNLARLSSAGEPLTAEVRNWTLEYFGTPIFDHFGQTELGMPAGFPHDPEIEIATKPNAMGVSFPGWKVLVLAAEEDAPASAGVTGRLAIDIAASPLFTFTGYGEDRDNRADRFTKDGSYYVTGDLATEDEDGLIRFSSRDDDVILMAGYRIGPFDVESTLATHPAVAECAVVAAPDEVRGEIIHAFVVLLSGHMGSPRLTAELQEWVKTNYGAHAYPRQIDYVDRLPKTESGKIRRAALREQVRGTANV